MYAEIIASGTELLMGETQDTNSSCGPDSMRGDPPVFRHSSHPTALGETSRI